MKDITHVVAIDGPAGAGKSTVAQRVAQALGMAFLDTGAMYRAVTWWVLGQALDLDDPEALAAAARDVPLEMREDMVLVAGRDVSAAIRSPEVTRQIHRLDQNPAVRAHLVQLQQAFGARQPTVAEGRDIGTVVFPRAKCKVYLDASLDERTRRRAAQLAAQGFEVDREALRLEIFERDRKSIERTESPLRRADDAVLIDTTGMGLDEVVDQIVGLAREAL